MTTPSYLFFHSILLPQLRRADRVSVSVTESGKGEHSGQQEPWVQLPGES